MNKSRIGSILEKLLVAALCLGVLLPLSPANMAVVYRDSGVFLAIGRAILNGQRPYLEVWDHKPPIIFYLNALGLWLGGGSRWGIWLLELVVLFVAALLGYELFKRVFGRSPALFSLGLWLLTLTFVIEGGNFTTEYTLSLQFLALWLVERAERYPSRLREWTLIGVLGGLAFFTKQTAIGLWLALGVYQVFVLLFDRAQTGTRVRQFLAMAGGTLGVVAGVGLFFYLQGAAGAFWQAAFVYNLFYASLELPVIERLKVILVIVGYVFIIGLVFRKNIHRSWMPLLTLGLLDFPAEMLLINLSGRNYIHYYMTILPALAIFFSSLAWGFGWLLSALRPPRIVNQIFQAGLIALILGGMALSCSKMTEVYRNTVQKHPELVAVQASIRYIEANTAPDDLVLIWGAEAAVNFLSRRNPPGRFIYQYPLYTPGYTDEALIVEFLDSLLQSPPRLIIDTKNPLTPFYAFPVDSPRIAEKIATLRSYYRPAGDLQGWTVYQYAP